MGNWENIIKTDKYKFIYLPSFPLYLKCQLYPGGVKASSACHSERRIPLGKPSLRREKPVKLEIARRVAKQGGPACGVPIYGFTGFERSGFYTLPIIKTITQG